MRETRDLPIAWFIPASVLQLIPCRDVPLPCPGAIRCSTWCKCRGLLEMVSVLNLRKGSIAAIFRVPNCIFKLVSSWCWRWSFPSVVVVVVRGVIVIGVLLIIVVVPINNNSSDRQRTPVEMAQQREYPTGFFSTTAKQVRMHRVLTAPCAINKRHDMVHTHELCPASHDQQIWEGLPNVNSFFAEPAGQEHAVEVHWSVSLVHWVLPPPPPPPGVLPPPPPPPHTFPMSTASSKSVIGSNDGIKSSPHSSYPNMLSTPAGRRAQLFALNKSRGGWGILVDLPKKNTAEPRAIYACTT